MSKKKKLGKSGGRRMGDETKHTPGPWEVVGHGVYTVADNPCREILWHGHNTRSALDKEREANAHLIAAAPEMLEALKNVKLALKMPVSFESIRLLVVEAIAKAEGGAS